MQTVFSNKTEAELIAERTTMRGKNDFPPEDLHLLESEAARRLEDFLTGDAEMEAAETPLFYAFIKTFGETDDAGLKALAKKAEVKITPLLKEFDRIAGYEDLGKVSAEEIGRNIAALDDFDRTDPFERDSDGEMVYPRFEKIEKVLDSVEILDDDGRPSAEGADMLKSTVLEAAKLKTYMRLCISLNEISRQFYMDVLQAEMELALVTLFLMDKSAAGYPVGRQEARKLHEEFQRLIDTLE